MASTQMGSTEAWAEMRLLRLDLDGFGTFRGPTSLDFSDTDYFALVGATGSGKTTIIDAICFALYGSAPRWPRRNMISLAMAPTVGHTRVVLVFESDGGAFAASRVLARSARGAVTTREARLVRLSVDIDSAIGTRSLPELLDTEAEVLADNDKAMDRAVPGLLGLTWEHFTQAVVLPQGDFAAFLHAGKAERQDLLVRLLGLDVFERVRARAGAVAKEQQTRIDVLRGQLDSYADATEEAELRAAAVVERFDALSAVLPAALDRWREAVVARDGVLAEAQLLAERDARLAGVRPPAALAELGVARSVAVETLEAAARKVTALEVAEGAAMQEADAAGQVAHWAATLRGHQRLDQVDAELSHCRLQLAEAQRTSDEAGRARTAAQRAVAAADTARDAVRRAHRADDLARTLHSGQPCPVCLQTVSEIPDRPAHPSLADSDDALAAARAELARTEEQEQVATVALGGLAGRVERLSSERADVAAELAEQPEHQATVAALARAEGAQRDFAAARAELRTAREARRSAAAELDGFDVSWRAAGQQLATLRDELASLQPPPLSDDHVADWQVLLAWASDCRDSLAAEAGVAAERVTTAEAAMAAGRDQLESLLAEVELALPQPLSEATIREAVGIAGESARNALRGICDRRAGVLRIAEQIADAASVEALHRDLAQLLNANNFERWLVEEALVAIVVDASERLLELSGGQFELRLDVRQDLQVVDHNDASVTRPVQTLSGGETFQASLALALALSEQLAALSTLATARLDTILLDEGFGTLDTATLDVVAATLEQLAGGGERTVGIVTHVAELAERVPVRFEVTRTGSTSTVTKVWA